MDQPRILSIMFAIYETLSILIIPFYLSCHLTYYWRLFTQGQIFTQLTAPNVCSSNNNEWTSFISVNFMSLLSHLQKDRNFSSFAFTVSVKFNNTDAS